MTTDADITAEGRLLAALKNGKAGFVNMVDTAAIEVFRDRYGNQDLFVSTWSSSALDPLAPRNHDLRFHIIAPEVETARVSAIEVAYYIMENFIPAECMDITYNGGGRGGNIAAGDNDDLAEKAGDTADTSGQAPQLCDQGAAGAGVAAGDNDDIGGNAVNTISTDAASEKDVMCVMTAAIPDAANAKRYILRSK